MANVQYFSKSKASTTEKNAVLANITTKIRQCTIPVTGDVNILSAVKVQEVRARILEQKCSCSFWFSHWFAAEVVGQCSLSIKIKSKSKIQKKKKSNIRIEKPLPEAGG